MTVKVEAISGPDNVTFLYLRGTHETDPQFVRVNTIARSMIAADPSKVAEQKALLIAQVEQAYADYVASQAALEGL